MQEFDKAMQHLEEKYGFMTSGHQYVSRKDEGDKLLRDGLMSGPTPFLCMHLVELQLPIVSQTIK
jgi:hypothetical protein